jgi:hypothetical protein
VLEKVVEFELETITPPNAELPTEYVVPLAGLVGGVEVEVLTTRYPGGVNDTETELAKAESESDVGWAVGIEHGTGGVQIKVNPDEGILLVEKETVDEFTAPVVVELQLVELVLLLNSALVVPPSPTWAVLALETAK